MRKLEVALASPLQVDNADVAARLIPTKNGDAGSVRRNFPVHIRRLAQFGSGQFLALALRGVQLAGCCGSCSRPSWVPLNQQQALALMENMLRLWRVLNDPNGSGLAAGVF